MRILVVVGALWCVACFGRVEPGDAPPVELDASPPCASRLAADGVTSAVVPHLDAPPWTRVFDGSRPSLDASVCQWHGAACACRPVREGEAVYATELPPTAFPAAP